MLRLVAYIEIGFTIIWGIQGVTNVSPRVSNTLYIFKQPMKPYKLIQVVNSDRSISPISSISSISLL